MVPARTHINRIKFGKDAVIIAMAEVAVYETNYTAESRLEFTRLLKEYDRGLAKATEERDMYYAIKRDPRVTALIAPIKSMCQERWETWKKDIKPIRDNLDRLSALPPGDVEEQKKLMQQVFIAYKKQMISAEAQEEPMQKLFKLENEETERMYEENKTVSQTFIQAQIAVLVTAAIVIILTFWSVFRAIMKPLELTRSTLEHVVADNDLTRRVDVKSEDEIGQMVKSFNGLTARLQEALTSVSGSTKDVLTTAQTLSSAASQVAESSASQSSATSAMAAAVEEMTVSIGTVAASADEAQTLTRNAGESSTEGSKIIQRTATEMSQIANSVNSASKVIDELGEESKQISSVVQVIKEVADQTNLLALNAAIEAARAGEQGRGFAVVADEVRKLAERTAQSTVDISMIVDKIQSSAGDAVVTMQRVVEQVKSGKDLAQDAGECMASIQSDAGNVSLAVTEISNALKEQNRASQDIAKHVERIAQMTDENNAVAEETSSNAQHLKQLAQTADKAISVFKV
jgi:methyl-accepting chemotaxis protein